MFFSILQVITRQAKQMERKDDEAMKKKGVINKAMLAITEDKGKSDEMLRMVDIGTMTD